jgi:molybdopterin synthase catalytic subunit
MNYVHLQSESIKLDELYQRVVAPSCGAVASFIGSYQSEEEKKKKKRRKIQSPSGFSSCIGITRDNFEGRRVSRLSYEAYESMALQELNRLCHAARQQFNDVEHIAICHRLG